MGTQDSHSHIDAGAVVCSGRFTVEWTMLQAVLHKYAIATGSKRQAVCALLLIDGTVLFYLCLGDGVRKAFGVKD